ncbi:MAG: aa3-type cytochrome oxidase subunit II [Marmoricola sp.]
MSLELPKRPRRRLSRLALGGVAVTALLLLSGCKADPNSQIKRLAMPVPATKEAPHTFDLWMWAWLAAMITGVIVWGLIFYAAWHFRRRSDDDAPVQTRYNLPIEVFYTIAPIIMVVTFFFFTVKAQDAVFHQFKKPDRTISVVGQQWSWTFNYNYNSGTRQSVGGPTVHEFGTPAHAPTLWLAKGEKTEIHLYSPDVIHSFWVPAFLFKLDVIPGRDNKFGITPTRLGHYDGRCAELCGLYHSKMLFNVKVVTKPQLQAHLAKLGKIPADRGPALGSTLTTTQPGLENAGSTTGGEQ